MFLDKEPSLTVEDYIYQCLCVHLVEYDERQQCLEYVIKKVNLKNLQMHLVNNDSPEQSMNIKECWNTSIADYTDESIEWLWIVVSSSALMWCGNKIQNMK